MGAAVTHGCAHCGAAIGPGSEYCCEGCRTVAALISGAGLERFYALGGRSGSPPSLDARRDRAWLEPIAAELARASGVTTVVLDVQGMHCSGCVWLLSELFRRRAGGVEVVVNPVLGRMTLYVEPAFDLAALVDEIERFGYRLGPALKDGSPARDALLIRTAVAIGLAANAMMFALAIYLGLAEGPLFELMRTLELVLALSAVAIGAPVFVRGALEGLRRGVLHLDLPIALGMLLALGGTLAAHATGAHAAYADTVAVFVALMLLGRWLQSRTIARNRDRLLRSQGADGLRARRIDAGSVALVRAGEISAGDRLLVAPGEIAVVDAVLEDPTAVALDWISGESEPRALAAGERLPAGAVVVGPSAVRARAETGFGASPLDALLGRVAPEADARGASALWDRISRAYVVLVLSIAALATAGWWIASGDPLRALEVATAILVVTCPCGIGIATPLGQELLIAALRRRGLFVRRERALERAPDVRRIVFDKTGTLTTGALELVDDAPLARLAPEDRDALGDMVARSAHAKSEAIRRALGPIRIREHLEVIEEPGRGVRASDARGELRLGAPSWAAPGADAGGADVVLARGGAILAALRTREILRPDAAREIAALERAGLEVRILSGDSRDRVDAIADRLGIDRGRAVAAASPEGKAAWIDAHRDVPTLFVGDGINDGPAADRADLAGTPAIDRPQLPARTDFFFVTAGLEPIRALVEGARTLRRVSLRNLVFAATYNAIAIGIAASGHMTPWLAAILMPASSIVVVGATAWSLNGARWRS